MSLSVKDYVCELQRILKSFAHTHDVTTIPSEHTGAFVSETAKLGSIGVQVRHRLTTHGFSVNITPQPIPWFDEVIACGLPGVNAVALADQKGVSLSVEGIVPSLLARVQHHLNTQLSPLSNSEDAEILRLIQETELSALHAGPWRTHPHSPVVQASSAH